MGLTYLRTRICFKCGDEKVGKLLPNPSSKDEEKTDLVLL